MSERVPGALAICLILAASASGQPAPLDLRGRTMAHDPSTIIKCKDRYYTFHTGNGILSSWSSNKVFWSAGPAVFQSPPAWTTNAVPEFTGTFWAPDVAYFSNQYHLYYSVSSWGKQVSAIGLVTNPTLDPADPSYKWTDHGIVIQSQNGSPYNTIDPGVTWDAEGKLWMVFGSYWTGIYLVQLDPTTGMRISADSPTYRLAYNGSIEASWIYYRGGYYYLFVNWGSCCSGINSTYNVRVGRSTRITGPYLDARGVDMVSGGGTVFMRATGKYTGPGHVGILKEGDTEWMSFHYYDANSWAPNYSAYGTAKLGITQLLWAPDNWPVYTNQWGAVYNFAYDARDSNRRSYGLLKNGASVQTTTDGRRALNLDGTGQYVWLPPGVANGQTVSAVVKWRGGSAWQRIFDFGFDTSKTFMLTPASGDGVLRCDLNPGSGVQILQWDRPLPSNVWTHVAVTVDGTRGILYVNGTPVVTNTSMTHLPYSGAFQTNHLGKSKFAADPDFNGQYAKVSIYSHALTRQEITAPSPETSKPAEGSTYAPGQKISFEGAASDFMALPLAPTNLTWTVHYVNGSVTNVIVGPLSGVTNGHFYIPATGTQATNGFYQITLQARDGAGRTALKTTRIIPGASSASWGSYYPFTMGGLDASNLYNATLYGATVQNDATRGLVLNLSGASQYLRLPMAATRAQTVSAWIKWRGGNSWQRLIDFGKGTGSWFYFTPKDGAGYPEAALTSDGSSYVQAMNTRDPFPLNTWTHVAIVVDGRQGILYFNGTAVAVNNSLDLLPSDVIGPNAFVGRSQFSADAYLNAQIDSLRIWGEPLEPEKMFGPFAHIQSPEVGSLFSGGETLTFSGEALDWTELPLPSSSSRWTVRYHQNGSEQMVLGPVYGPSANYSIPNVGPLTTNIFYDVGLLVTNASGLLASSATTLLPRISRMQFDTVPQGLALELEGTGISGGTSVDLVSGYSRMITAPSVQNVAGTNYEFVLWSDGGAPSHWFTVPETNLTLTGSYVEPDLELSRANGGADSLAISWPGWAAPLGVFTSTNVATGPWVYVTNQPTPSGESLTLTVPITGGQQFFRLQPR